MLSDEQRLQIQSYLQAKQNPVQTGISSGSSLRDKLQQSYIQKEVESRVSQPKEQSKFSDIFKVAGNMVSDFTKSTIESGKERFGKIKESGEAMLSGEENLLVGLGQQAGNTIGMIGDTVFNAMKATFNQLDDNTKEKIKSGTSSIVSDIVNAQINKFERMKTEDPEGAKEIQNIIDTTKLIANEIQNNPSYKRSFEALIGASDLIGIGPTSRVTKNVAKPIMEATENLGKTGLKNVGEIAGEVATKAGTKLEQGLVKQNLNDTLSLVKKAPTEMTKSEKISALSSGRGTENTFGKVEIKPTLRDYDVAEVASGFVDKNKKFTENIYNLNDAIKGKSNSLRSYLKKTNIPAGDTNELRKSISSIGLPLTLKTDTQMKKMYDEVVNKFMEFTKNKTNMEGILDARQEFDNWAEKNIPGIFDENGKYKPLHEAILRVRQKSNDYIAENAYHFAPDNLKNPIRQSLKEQNLLYEAKDNFATNNYKNIGKDWINKLSTSIRKNPISNAIGIGAIGLTLPAAMGIISSPVALAGLATYGTYRLGKKIVTSEALRKGLSEFLLKAGNTLNPESKVQIDELIDLLKSRAGLSIEDVSQKGFNSPTVGKTVKSIEDPLIQEANGKSLEEFVRAQGDMQFVHNLSPEQIIKANELGGLPAPSIATVNPNKTDFTRFGEISLIPKKSVIDGQKTVLSDAYTQTFGNIDKLPDNISTKRGAEWIDDAMQKEWGAGAKTPSGFVRSQLVEEVDSIADIQKNISKLTSKSYGDKIKADIDYAIHSLAERINKNPNDLIEARKARNIINNAILGKTNGLSQDIISEINKLRQKIIKAPTEYFETKIGRNVGLDEFSHALVPKGISQDVIKVLKDKGVIVIEKTGKNDLSNLTKSQLTDIWNKANKTVEKKPIIIDPDLLKKEANDFNPKNHEIYSKKAKEMYEKELKTNKNPVVKFTAGGSGSGKSEILLEKASNNFDGIILDATLADFKSASEKINKALKAGKNVEIDAILPRIESAWKFSQRRGLNTGRNVPLETFVDKHIGFTNTLQKIIKEFPEIKISLLDTRKIFNKQDAINIKSIKDKDVISRILKEAFNGKNKEQLIDKLKNINYSGISVDFSKPGSFGVFRQKGRNYMISSAENPMGSIQDKSINKLKTKLFRDFLNENNIKYYPQKGKYGGNLEASQLIEIKTPNERKLIDNWLEKNSPQAENIIIKDGKVFRYDPRTFDAYGVDLGKLKNKDLGLEDSTTDFYSEIMGRKYRFPLYDETVEKPIYKDSFLVYYNN